MKKGTQTGNKIAATHFQGMIRRGELDLERDKALNSLGYQVFRIDLEKENLSRFMENSDIRKCLKKYLLNQ